MYVLYVLLLPFFGPKVSAKSACPIFLKYFHRFHIFRPEQTHEKLFEQFQISKPLLANIFITYSNRFLVFVLKNWFMGSIWEHNLKVRKWGSNYTVLNYCYEQFYIQTVQRLRLDSVSRRKKGKPPNHMTDLN